MKKIKINEDKCVGCGLCTTTCQHGVIEIVDGVAKVVNENYCDGIGNCIPACPVDAISFQEEATNGCGCQSSAPKSLSKPKLVSPNQSRIDSKLQQWPVQIQLVPENAPYFDNANLLIAADCSAFAYGNFHNDFMKNKITIIGCPKLDEVDYTNKLQRIITNNNIKSVTIVRMEVPCCGGIEHATMTALKNSGKFIPWSVHTISIDGEIIE